MNNRTCSFPECNKPLTERGLCNAHAKQQRKGQELKPLKKRACAAYGTIQEALETHTVKSAGCWEWSGVRDPNGYARMSFKGVGVLPYRAWFEVANGPIPDGMHLDHMCHNRGCVNPAHRRTVTVKQNGEHRKGANTNSKTGVRGVHWSESRQRFIGLVEHNGKPVMNRRFKTLEEAEAAVVAKRLEVFTHSDADRAKA